jgi:prenyltransferase beta subunit
MTTSKQILSCLLCLTIATMPLARLRAADEDVKVAELSPQAEAAIDKALTYIVKTQGADGSWGGTQYPVAITALSLMAFMVKGNFPDKGPYGEAMSKGLDYLLKESKKGGGYMGESMYAHGLATLALSEVWGMSNREDLRPALKRAVEIIIRAQAKNGGWRYNPQPVDADISVTVMQIVALASAKEAGIFVPNTTIEKAIEYVKTCQDKNGGFCYTPGSAPGFARTAAGCLSLTMCGQRNSDEVKRGLAYLKGLPDTKYSEIEFYFYGHYYAMQAMYQAGESYYQEWYPKMRDALVSKQNPAGAWGEAGSYYTPMAVLILGVPYRFLPIYQR